MLHQLDPRLLIPWMELAWSNEQIIGSAKLVFLTLAWMINMEGEAATTIPALCRLTGLSKSTVLAQIRSLEQSKIIEHRRGKRGTIFQVVGGLPPCVRQLHDDLAVKGVNLDYP